jgi:hypothetical protein
MHYSHFATVDVKTGQIDHDPEIINVFRGLEFHRDRMLLAVDRQSEGFNTDPA